MTEELVDRLAALEEGTKSLRSDVERVDRAMGALSAALLIVGVVLAVTRTWPAVGWPLAAFGLVLALLEGTHGRDWPWG